MYTGNYTNDFVTGFPSADTGLPLRLNHKPIPSIRYVCHKLCGRGINNILYNSKSIPAYDLCAV